MNKELKNPVMPPPEPAAAETLLAGPDDAKPCTAAIPAVVAAAVLTNPSTPLIL